MATATAAIPASDTAVASPALEVLRDISRGGFAGILIGLVGCGIGGRLVMRLAALLIPGADGHFTENGFLIGNITVGGTVALLVNGLAFGVIGGTIWVVVSPWIPGVGLRRAALTVVVAIAIGGQTLIQGSNEDFRILEHSVAVVASLVGLVALVGLSFALVDDWLEQRMPHPTSRRSPVAWLYGGVALIGTVLVLPLTLAVFLLSHTSSLVALGIALVITGLATLAWWIHRQRGPAEPTAKEVMVGRGGLLVLTVIGLITFVPELAGALGA